MKWGTGMLSSKEEKLSKNSGTEVGNFPISTLSSASPSLPRLIPATLLLSQSGALMIMEEMIKEEKKES